MGGLVVGSGFPSFIGESEVGAPIVPPVGGLPRYRIDYTKFRHDSTLRHGLLAFFPLFDEGLRQQEIAGFSPATDQGRSQFAWALERLNLPGRGGKVSASLVTIPENTLSLGTNVFAARPNQGSVSFWFRAADVDPSGDMFLFQMGNNADGVYLMVTAADGRGQIIFAVSGIPAGWVVTTSTTLNDGRWHHLVYTSDGSVWKIFIDGIEQGLTVVLGLNSGYWYEDIGIDSTPAQIINQTFGATFHQIGISDVGVWDRPLSSTEIGQLAFEPDSVYFRQRRVTILDRFRMHPAGIASSEALGSPEAAHTLKPSAIDSAFAFGLAELIHVLKPTAIPSAEALGIPNLAYLLRPVGIASAEAHGIGELVHVLKFDGVASAEAHGTTELAHVLKAIGIGSAELLGMPELVHVLKPGAIPSAEALGIPNLALLISPAGIASAEEHGTPELIHILKMLGIASGEAFGLLVLTGPVVADISAGILARARVGEVDLEAVAGGIVIALGQAGQLFVIARLGGPHGQSSAGGVSGEAKL